MNLAETTIRLNVLYSLIPTPTGCEKCAKYNGENRKHWCCTEQNPSIPPEEFKMIWAEVQTWSRCDREHLMRRTFENLLRPKIGCPFYENKCSIYDKRPIMCRMFGQQSKDYIEAAQKRFGSKFSHCDIPDSSLTKKQEIYLIGRFSELSNTNKSIHIHIWILRQFLTEDEIQSIRPTMSPSVLFAMYKSRI